MIRVVLTDEQWVTLWTFRVAHPRVYVGRPEACRRLLNAVLWVRRSGALGRVLPPDLGRFNRGFQRCSRWGARGVWTAGPQQVAHDPDVPAVF